MDRLRHSSGLPTWATPADLPQPITVWSCGEAPTVGRARVADPEHSLRRKLSVETPDRLDVLHEAAPNVKAHLVDKGFEGPVHPEIVD